MLHRLATLALALLIDRLGEPPTELHPVGWIGWLISRLERFAPSNPKSELAYGGFLLMVTVLSTVAAQMALARAAQRLSQPWRLFAEALLLKWTFSLAMLERAALAVRDDLVNGDISAARQSLRGLVSRPTETLSPELVAASAIESVAENASDSVVAPLLWWTIGGLPAAAAYRAVNTADAMVGYHGRYERLGRLSARMDDALNLAASRITAMALCASTPRSHSRMAQALSIAVRDHGSTESPNAGWPMAAMAGSLGRRLEKPGYYMLGEELPLPGPRDIDRAVRRTRAAIGVTIATVAVGGVLLNGCTGGRKLLRCPG